MRFLALLVLVFGVAVVTAKQTYHGHRLVSVTAKNKQQLNVLTEMMRTATPWLDFWSNPGVNKTADVRVPPKSYGTFMRQMKNANIPLTIHGHDVEELLELGSRTTFGPHVKNSPFISWTGGYTTHTHYRRYQEFIDIMTGMRSSFASLVKEVGVLNSKTFENRDMYFIRLGTGLNKPVIFIEGLIHAREWIVGGVMVYLMDRLVSRYAIDADARFLMDNYDIYIVPVTNPDGYEYSHTSSRLWRKNRSPGSGNCRGTDLNRNFDAFWGTTGISNNCNSDIYCGPSVFSEKESQMIRDKVAEIRAGGSSLVAYLAVHSYSQLLLTPYSYQYNTYPPNRNEIDNLANQMNDALRAPFGTNYQAGNGPALLYPVSGASDDWGMLGGGARYVYTYELQPASSSPGFQLSPSYILPNGYEFWRSLVAFGCNANAGEPPCEF